MKEGEIMLNFWSLILLLLSAFYIIGAIFEFPIMFEGNPKSRFLMQKFGKKTLKIIMIVLGIALGVVAIIIR